MRADVVIGPYRSLASTEVVATSGEVRGIECGVKPTLRAVGDAGPYNVKKDLL